MDWSIVTGAGIAILSSSITIIINYVFQNKQLEKKREWDIEDEKNSIRKNTILQRLSKMEEYIQLMAEHYSQLELRCTVIDLKVYENIIGNEKSLLPKYQENWYLTYLMHYFDDEQLPNYYLKLMDLHKQAVGIEREYSDAILNGENDKLHDILDRLVRLDYRSVYLKLLKRIDHIKEEYMTIE